MYYCFTISLIVMFKYWVSLLKFISKGSTSILSISKTLIFGLKQVSSKFWITIPLNPLLNLTHVPNGYGATFFTKTLIKTERRKK